MQLVQHIHDFLQQADWVQESPNAQHGPWINQEGPESTDTVHVQFGIDEAFNIYIREAYFINEQGNKVELLEGSDVFGNDLSLHSELELILPGYNATDVVREVINEQVLARFVEMKLPYKKMLMQPEL